jgi:hypothetical protein
MRTLMKATSITAVSTLGLVLLAGQVQEIGERIPYVLLSAWLGSAMLAALIFSSGCVVPHSSATAQNVDARQRMWTYKMRAIGVSLLPLAFVPLLELRRSGYDPALWLMNGVLIFSICSVPYYWLLARSITGAVVLSVVSLSLLWHFSAWAFFLVIRHMESAKAASTVDTSATLHAFLAPEYRCFFYCLCGMALLAYCPVMMWLGYRRFLTDRTARLAPARTGFSDH